MSMFGVLGFSGAMGTPPKKVSRPSSPRREYSKEIPFEVMIDIFSRLTVEDVARCRCVSKPWSQFLRSPAFTELFLELSSARPRLLFTFLHNGKRQFYSAPQTIDPSRTFSYYVSAFYHMGFPKGLGSPEEISPPLLGSICIKARKPILCNPSTGEYIVYPTVINKRTEMKHLFGFDSGETLFKVLSVSQRYGCRVSTLLIGAVSCRTVECSIPHEPFNVEISINGVLYYLARSKDYIRTSPYTYMVVCFHLTSEKFRFIGLESDFVCQSTLINHQGKLGVIWPNTGGITKHTRSFELLVLEDVANELKWLKSAYKLPFYWRNLHVKFLNIVGMTSAGEIVLSTSHLRKPFYIFYFSVVTGIVARVEIDFGSVVGLKADSHPKVFTYTDHVENVQLYDCDVKKVA